MMYKTVWLGPGGATIRRSERATGRETIERQVFRLGVALYLGIMDDIIPSGWRLWAVEEIRATKAAQDGLKRPGGNGGENG